VIIGSERIGFTFYFFIMFCNVVDSNDLIDMFTLKHIIMVVGEVTGMFSKIFKKLILK
jgi:hypothetical protein